MRGNYQLVYYDAKNVGIIGILRIQKFCDYQDFMKYRMTTEVIEGHRRSSFHIVARFRDFFSNLYS